MPHLFRVWDACRKKKNTFVLEDSVDIVNNLLHNSSEKFGVKGVSIVLEKCGSVIDDAESLIMLNKQVFIVLSENQIWQKESSETDISDSLSNDGETVVPENVNSDSNAFNSNCERSLYIYVYTHTHTHTHIHTHARTRAHTHTHTHRLPNLT